MAIVIDHEAYGERSVFDDLDDAHKAVHACGDDFADTVFEIQGDDVYDEQGNCVGEVIEIMGWTSIPTSSGIHIVKEVLLTEAEEVERREYHHPYVDRYAWLPVYDSEDAARTGDIEHAL